MRLILCVLCCQSLVIPEKFQHILRVLNTNIDGRRKIAFAITAIKVSSPQYTALYLIVSHAAYFEFKVKAWIYLLAVFI